MKPRNQRSAEVAKAERERWKAQLNEHRLPPLTAAPGLYRWADGCTLTVERIVDGYSAGTLYHPGPKHVADHVAPWLELTVTP